MTLGPLMMDIQGTELTEEDRQLLVHEQVGGLILFSRNFQNPEQIKQLTDSVRELRPELLIAVDQEGGRVQRFREGFTKLPAVGHLGKIYGNDPQFAFETARELGWLMASEMLSVGVDLSFAPVLDIDYGNNTVIGLRAFGSEPEIIIELAGGYMAGMKEAGMKTCGKHFPGHGHVAADSHVAIPKDRRVWTEIERTDLSIFKALIEHLDSLMPAHVIYTEVDSSPAGFSSHWIQSVLKQQLGFKGVLFSDDLGMAGAAIAGGFAERAQAAIAAGVDMILVCNQRNAVKEVLSYLEAHPVSSSEKFEYLKGEFGNSLEGLKDNPRWQEATKLATFIDEQ